MHSTTCKRQSYQITTKTAKNYNKMPPSSLLFVSLILTFSTMMQQAFAEDMNNPITSTAICSKLKCENGCPAVPISHNDLTKNSIKLTNHQNTSSTCICPEQCNIELSCTHFLTDVREFIHLRHMSEKKNPYDPCETFFCRNGTISIHMATCKAINCPTYHRIRPDGECCDVCDNQQSTFCDDSLDCDMVCRYSYVRDEDKNCDLCKCARSSTAATTRTTTTERSTSISSIEGVKVTENEPKIFSFFDFIEINSLNCLYAVLIFFAVLILVYIFVHCFCLRQKKINNHVPLINHRNSIITQQYA